MATRTEIVVTFLALLELIRLRKLRVAQSEAFSEIDIVRADEESPAAAEPPPPAEISSTLEDPAPASTTLAEGA